LSRQNSPRPSCSHNWQPSQHAPHWRGRRVLVLAEEFDGLEPGGFLHAVEFAQVKHVALDDALVGQPPVFHDTPIEVLLAILATL
jgi:hypothetical protein